MGLYTSTQRFLRAGFKLFYRKVHLLHLNRVPVKGPVLLVSNHPNSFMDALVIGAYLPRPTNFLARGDAFSKPALAKIFKAYHMLPVYRASEGKENIEKNFETFDASYEVINKGECMLIFGEGLSVNNWQLRPLKKGPARIAKRAWESEGLAKNLVIIPVGLTYSHYKGADKSVIVHYGNPITREDFSSQLQASTFTTQLNEAIASQLNELAFFDSTLSENPDAQKQFLTHWKTAEHNNATRILESIKAFQPEPGKGRKPSFLNKVNSTLITVPHYHASKLITGKLTRGTVFYDSVLFILYWFLMPVYLLVLFILVLGFSL